MTQQSTQQNPGINLRIEAASGAVGTRDLRNFVRCAAGVIGLGETHQHHLVTALSEFCNNVARHAQPAASRIQVQLRQNAGTWEIDIMDDGGEFNPITSSKFEPLRTGNSALRSSGMGIALIATCFPDCSYSGKSANEDHFNHFRIPLHLPEKTHS